MYGKCSSSYKNVVGEISNLLPSSLARLIGGSLTPPPMVQVQGVRRQPTYAGVAPKMLDLGHPSFSSLADCSSAKRPASARRRRQRQGASVLRLKAGKAE